MRLLSKVTKLENIYLYHTVLNALPSYSKVPFHRARQGTMVPIYAVKLDKTNSLEAGHREYTKVLILESTNTCCK